MHNDRPNFSIQNRKHTWSNEDVLGFPMPENINELQQDIQGRSKLYILQIMARHTHIITFDILFYRIWKQEKVIWSIVFVAVYFGMR